MAYVIYSKPGCGFCDKAKDLLTAKNISYNEIILDVGQDKDPSKNYVSVDTLRELIPGVRTVPQIFKDGVLIGGFEALQKMV